jgi:Tissue inhibitor of metalloproteinase
LLVTAVAYVGLIGAESALACTCAAQRVDDQLANADAALVGKLVDVDRVSPGSVKLKYRVKRVFKGAPGLDRGDKLTLRSPASGAACGLPRKKNKRYGLLLDRRRKRLTANLCSVVSPKKLRRAAAGKVKGKRCAR